MTAIPTISRKEFMKFLFDKCIEITSRKNEDEVWELVSQQIQKARNDALDEAKGEFIKNVYPSWGLGTVIEILDKLKTPQK